MIGEEGDGESAAARASKPIPPLPPPPVVLPPTDPAAFTLPPELEEIERHFAAGEFRKCVEPIEALYFARRNTLHQGLLQYVVALLQLRRGLVATPRRLLTQALALWEPYPAWQEGLALGDLREHARDLLERLPAGIREATLEEIEGWWVEPPVMSRSPVTRKP